MRACWFRSVVAAAVIGLTTTATHGQSSPVGFQAKLTGVGDGPHTMTFTLFDAATEGTLLHSSGPLGVTVTGGVLSTAVDVPNDVLDGTMRWWSVSIDGGSPLPRQRLLAVPHAVVAERARPDRTFTTGQFVAQYTPGSATQSGTALFQLLEGGGDLRLYANWKENGTTLVDLFPLLFTVDGSRRFSMNGRGQILSRADLAGILNTAGAHFYLDSDGQHVDLALNYKAQNTTPDELYPLRVETSSGVPFSVRADGRTTTRILTITGGSDLAESFGVTGHSATEYAAGDPRAMQPMPGMVMSIDAANPGKLRIANSPYDTKVAGVISGAGGLGPGMVMGKTGDDLTSGEHPVAMTGRVWVLADAGFGPIAPGDRLTTSATPGHAMRVSDEVRSIGSVVGKAMTNLDEGKGLVLVLVNLQ